MKLFWIGLGFQRVGMSLFMTLYMLYLTRDLELTFGLAMSLNIVYMGLAIPLEIATGWIGDRFGHRNSVVIGLFLGRVFRRMRFLDGGHGSFRFVRSWRSSGRCSGLGLDFRLSSGWCLVSHWFLC